MIDNPPIVPTVQREGRHLVMPGMATVHSHAFQRALRGRTQRRSTAAATFWTWRGLMFALAERLNPRDALQYRALRLCGAGHVGRDGGRRVSLPASRPRRAPIRRSGRAVGGHDPRPRAAAGIRITLIRAAYHARRLSAGVWRPGQQRFCDPSVEQVLADVETLRARYAHDPPWCGSPSRRIAFAPCR